MPGLIASKLCLGAPTSRAGTRIGLAAAILLVGCQSLQNAVADGDTRSITMHHLHTKETITVTFKRSGRYDEAALKKLNWFLRDWRENRDTRMDPRLIDLVWEVYREVDATRPIEIICGYRDESTNTMLRRRSNGVAQNSLHMSGKAMDFAIPGVSLDKLRAAGLRLQRGGVGFYPSSGSAFVHMDIGGVRHWPRMTREQLVRVFPNGRTVHVPTDGKPLPGYALALADIERRGGSPSSVSIAAANDAGIDTETTGAAGQPRRSLLAGLFGSLDTDEAKEAKNHTAPAPVRVAAAPATAMLPVPLPKMRPASAPIVVAMALPAPRPAAEAPASELLKSVVAASPSPSEIIKARGYWVGVPDMARPAATAARQKADPVTTASLPPALRPPSAEAAGQRLAYAPLPERHPPTRAPRRTVVMPQAQAATTVAVKGGEAPALAALPIFDPWLDAVIITPSVRHFLSSTQYGVRDFRGLQPYLDKPAMTVAMAFSADPHQGLDAGRFGGRAVVFLRTQAFAATAAGLSRTASLR